ncbi:MAG: hypothetical protein U0176_11930 [Bacteroidia bacterium]
MPVIGLGPDRIGCAGTPLLLMQEPPRRKHIGQSTNATSQSISVATSGTYWVRSPMPPDAFTEHRQCHLQSDPVIALGQNQHHLPGQQPRTSTQANPGSTTSGPPEKPPRPSPPT